MQAEGAETSLLRIVAFSSAMVQRPRTCVKLARLDATYDLS